MRYFWILQMDLWVWTEVIWEGSNSETFESIILKSLALNGIALFFWKSGSFWISVATFTKLFNISVKYYVDSRVWNKTKPLTEELEVRLSLRVTINVGAEQIEWKASMHKKRSYSCSALWRYATILSISSSPSSRVIKIRVAALSVLRTKMWD